jgi:hypothetical protein
MNNYIWVVEELNENNQWGPCADCALFFRDGQNLLRYWKQNITNRKVRLRKYRPVNDSETEE